MNGRSQAAEERFKSIVREAMHKSWEACLLNGSSCHGNHIVFPSCINFRAMDTLFPYSGGMAQALSTSRGVRPNRPTGHSGSCVNLIDPRS